MIHYYENRDSVIMQSLSNPSQNQCDRGQKALLYGVLQQNSSLLLKNCEVYAIVQKEHMQKSLLTMKMILSMSEFSL